MANFSDNFNITWGNENIRFFRRCISSWLTIWVLDLGQNIIVCLVASTWTYRWCPDTLQEQSWHRLIHEQFSVQRETFSSIFGPKCFRLKLFGAEWVLTDFSWVRLLVQSVIWRRTSSRVRDNSFLDAVALHYFY